jgi:hypothetical protein
LKIAYFVHDLTDPAVARRVRMLKAGGAEPVVLGFRREAEAPAGVAGAPAIDLGRTHDGRFVQRAGLTALNALTAARLAEHVKGAEVVMARMLESLAIAEAARALAAPKARLVYEALDIHRLLVGEGVKSRALRAAERALMRRADLLVVSSPAFLERYYRPMQGVGRELAIPTLLVENKVLELADEADAPAFDPPPGPPWRIGWLGAIRCAKSLAILTDLAARRPDLVEVRIWGRPAYSEFADFDAQVRALPNLAFGGSYTAADLPGLYGQVHFAWAIDFMEEGLNSAWLLPNRLYEASRHGAVPIALKGVQTGRYLAEHGFGVTLETAAELEAVLERLTPAAYAGLRATVEAQPREAFVAGPDDCRALVAALAGQPAPSVSWAPEKLTAKAFEQPEHIPGEAV